jgi:hypothetical protein
MRCMKYVCYTGSSILVTCIQTSVTIEDHRAAMCVGIKSRVCGSIRNMVGTDIFLHKSLGLYINPLLLLLLGATSPMFVKFRICMRPMANTYVQ